MLTMKRVIPIANNLVKFVEVKRVKGWYHKHRPRKIPFARLRDIKFNGGPYVYVNPLFGY